MSLVTVTNFISMADQMGQYYKTMATAVDTVDTVSDTLLDFVEALNDYDQLHSLLEAANQVVIGTTKEAILRSTGIAGLISGLDSHFSTYGSTVHSTINSMATFLSYKNEVNPTTWVSPVSSYFQKLVNAVTSSTALLPYTYALVSTGNQAASGMGELAGGTFSAGVAYTDGHVEAKAKIESEVSYTGPGVVDVTYVDNAGVTQTGTVTLNNSPVAANTEINVLLVAAKARIKSVTNIAAHAGTAITGGHIFIKPLKLHDVDGARDLGD